MKRIKLELGEILEIETPSGTRIQVNVASDFNQTITGNIGVEVLLADTQELAPRRNGSIYIQKRESSHL